MYRIVLTERPEGSVFRSARSMLRSRPWTGGLPPNLETRLLSDSASTTTTSGPVWTSSERAPSSSVCGCARKHLSYLRKVSPDAAYESTVALRPISCYIHHSSCRARRRDCRWYTIHVDKATALPVSAWPRPVPQGPHVGKPLLQRASRHT